MNVSNEYNKLPLAVRRIASVVSREQRIRDLEAEVDHVRSVSRKRVSEIRDLIAVQRRFNKELMLEIENEKAISK